MAEGKGEGDQDVDQGKDERWTEQLKSLHSRIPMHPQHIEIT